MRKITAEIIGKDIFTKTGDKFWAEALDKIKDALNAGSAGGLIIILPPLEKIAEVANSFKDEGDSRMQTVSGCNMILPSKLAMLMDEVRITKERVEEENPMAAAVLALFKKLKEVEDA